MKYLFALLLGLVDLVIGLGLRGLLRPAATAGLAFFLLGTAAPAFLFPRKPPATASDPPAGST